MGFLHNLIYGKKKKKDIDMRRPHIIIRKGAKKGLIDPLEFWGQRRRERRAERR